jgi:citrate lyase subunit beta/citryl-CoA lyase
MSLRSVLFVPGDSEKKYRKALGTAADAVILDLEDSVSGARKSNARDFVAAALREKPENVRAEIWVRVNPVDTEEGLRDLAAVVAARPNGIMLPKCEGAATVQKLDHCLDVLEAGGGVPPGQTGIFPIVTETPRAAFALGDFAKATFPRLVAMTWGAEDLSSVVGASTNKDSGGGWAITYAMLRSMTLLAAKAAGVEAVDTLYADFRDMEGLRRDCKSAWREGFTGKIAIHPDQVDVINACFMPSREEIAFAERVHAAFDAQPGAGTVSLDGRMLDLPHLKQAEHILARAKDA